MRVSSGLYKRQSRVAFDERLNDLMAFKVKYGHCDVSQHGEDASDVIRSK